MASKLRSSSPTAGWRSRLRPLRWNLTFDIDLDVVWNTVTRDLPKLQEICHQDPCRA